MAKLTFIVEFENATLKGVEELAEFLQSLRAEIEANRNYRPFEIICASPGSGVVGALRNVQETVRKLREDFIAIADVRVIEIPGARYYELKNEAAKEARGDIIVFVDSDVMVQPGWLKNLLAPMADPEVMVTTGLTSFLANDFLSRTFALSWFFPLPNDDPARRVKRGLFANNIAYRRHFFLANPYPEDDGFKVACTLHARALKNSGAKIVMTDALAYHHFWEDGIGFLFWRAAVAGRDADRKIVAAGTTARGGRMVRALRSALAKLEAVPRRIIRDRQKVGMPWYEVPPAIVLSLGFYFLVFLSQLSAAAGLSRPRVERLPARFHVH